MAKPQVQIEVMSRQVFSLGECPYCTSGVDYLFTGVRITQGNDGSGNYTRDVWLERPIEVETRNDGLLFKGETNGTNTEVFVALEDTAFTSMDSFRSMVFAAMAGLAQDAENKLYYKVEGSRLYVRAGAYDGDGTGSDESENATCMIKTHMLENECGYVRTCSNAAIGFSLNSGLASFTIPSGTDLFRIELRGDASKTKTDDDLDVEITWEGTRPFNTGNCNIMRPIVVPWNDSAEDAGGPTETLPFIQGTLDQPQVQIIQVGNGAASYLKLRIKSLSSTFPKWAVVLSFS